MGRTTAEKMGVRTGARSLMMDAPAEVVESMNLPPVDLQENLQGDFDYLHLFTTTQKALEEAFAPLRKHLEPRGMLWVSWPKGHKLGSDLTLRDVIRIGYSQGLVESTVLSVDDTWSAIKFTPPKPGKTYRNSYGALPQTPP